MATLIENTLGTGVVCSCCNKPFINGEASNHLFCGMYKHTCKNCGDQFITDDPDEYQDLCNSCCDDYVGYMHNDIVSVDDKVKMASKITKPNSSKELFDMDLDYLIRELSQHSFDGCNQEADKDFDEIVRICEKRERVIRLEERKKVLEGLLNSFMENGENGLFILNKIKIELSKFKN